MKIFLISLFLNTNSSFAKNVDLELLKDKTSVEFEAKGTPSILSRKCNVG
jgi:hypothetical protein